MEQTVSVRPCWNQQETILADKHPPDDMDPAVGHQEKIGAPASEAF
jgi:hypothetical protein